MQQEKLVISAAGGGSRARREGKGGCSGVFYVEIKKGRLGGVFDCIFLGDRLGRLFSSY